MRSIFTNLNIGIDIEKVILENIDIKKENLENLNIDINREILENIDLAYQKGLPRSAVEAPVRYQGHDIDAAHPGTLCESLFLDSSRPVNLDSIAVSVFVLSFTCIYLSLTIRNKNQRNTDWKN